MLETWLQFPQKFVYFTRVLALSKFFLEPKTIDVFS